MPTSIQGKVALVTGANRGIGKAIVESFIKHGAKKVYLAVRDPSTTAELHHTYGDKVSTIPADLSNPASINALAQQAPDVQILVNNAGVLEIADPLSDSAEQALHEEMEVNVFGLIRMAKAFAPVLEANGDGAIVQMNSVASVINFADFSTYSASKAAAYSITQGLREKLTPRGIQVLSVHPGPINTDMAKKAGFEGEPVGVVSEGIVEALRSGQFHLFPDSTAKGMWEAYSPFAAAVIETPSEAA